MAELCESSGLHSLASLREHEKRRAEQQASAARARAEAEQRARVEAERDAARLEHERRLAEQAARAESAQRAELLQLESGQRAEYERAEGLLRENAELKSQLGREREARRSTELELTSQLLRQRLLSSASAALCVSSWLLLAGLYFGALRPNAERALEASQQALLGERRTRSEAQQNEARSMRRVDELTARVGSLERELHAERAQRVPPQVPLAPGRRWTTREPRVPPPVVKPCRDDGDPLNPCLKR